MISEMLILISEKELTYAREVALNEI